MRFKLVLPFVMIALLFASCQKESTGVVENDPVQEAAALEAEAKLIALINEKHLVSSLKLSPAQIEEFSRKIAKGSLETRSLSEKYLRLALNSDYNRYRDLVAKAINPADYECGGPSIFDDYFSEITKDWTRQDGQLFGTFGDLAFAKSYVLDNKEENEYFGPYGEFTCNVNYTFRDLKRFWDIPGNIILIDAHGSVYKDEQTTAQLIQMFVAYPDANGKPGPFPADKAKEVAGLLKIVFGSAKFQNYNHPLFTFNALAEMDIPELGIVKKIIMGDGVMQGYAALGYNDIAPQFVLAHEFGHQIDFANAHIDPSISNAEYTRALELRADGYAGYFAGHSQGLVWPSRKLGHLLDLPYSVGDCAFTSPGHHGTPNQRKKAGNVGYQAAYGQRKSSTKLKSEQFYKVFNAALPKILEPDAVLGFKKMVFTETSIWFI
jgi:hypothetical protein